MAAPPPVLAAPRQGRAARVCPVLAGAVMLGKHLGGSLCFFCSSEESAFLFPPHAGTGSRGQWVSSGADLRGAPGFADSRRRHPRLPSDPGLVAGREAGVCWVQPLLAGAAVWAGAGVPPGAQLGRAARPGGWGCAVSTGRAGVKSPEEPPPPPVPAAGAFALGAPG